MDLFVICQAENCPQISELECTNCGHHSCQAHIGEHMNAHSNISIQNILQRIQQEEYEYLKLQVQRFKETLNARLAEVLLEMNEQAAPYLEKINQINLLHWKKNLYNHTKHLIKSTKLVSRTFRTNICGDISQIRGWAMVCLRHTLKTNTSRYIMQLNLFH